MLGDFLVVTKMQVTIIIKMMYDNTIMCSSSTFIYVPLLADECAWKFGNTYTTANGAKANMKMGSRDFLVQQNWIVDQNQCCMTGYSNL